MGFSATYKDSRGRRTLLRILSPVMLGVVLTAIWLLTIQTPTETVSLSDVYIRALSRLSGMSYDRAFWVVRKVVHTVEFFPVGLSMALTALAWGDTGPTSRRRRPGVAAAVIGLCFACSLGDQVHKAFVPGREFDALDMAFDAAGYLLGVLVATKVCRPLRGPRHLAR